MKAHTQIYLKAFGFDVSDFIPCEFCGSKAVDIHHIQCKGMGGSKDKDFIENLMALCRYHHDIWGDRAKYMRKLKDRHTLIMLNHGVKFDIKKMQ